MMNYQEDNLTYGQIIKNRRKKKRLTQMDLAIKAKITAPYVTTMETDNLPSCPSEKTLCKIADALDIERDYLLFKAKVLPKYIYDIMVDNPDKVYQLLEEINNAND